MEKIYRRQMLLDPSLKVSSVHGGEYSKGSRKIARPIATKKSMHLVMRSSMAKGKLSLLHPNHSKFVSKLVQNASKKFRIKIFEFSNNGNHLHFLLRAETRKGFQSFLRVISASIAMGVTQTKKGIRSLKKFWDLLPFTRVVAWGKAFLIAKKYIIQNQLEALGLISYQRRHKRAPKGMAFS